MPRSAPDGRAITSAAPETRTSDEAKNVEGVFDSYGRYWLEMLRLPAEVRSGNVNTYCTIDGFEHIEAGLERGNGVILALPHLGGWEWAGAAMALRGHRLLAVVENIEPPQLLELVRRAAGRDRDRRRDRSGPTCRALCCGRCATTASCACSPIATSRATG